MLVPDQAATLASALKEQGYETFQFGKNHLGDLNKYLPCLHGFDEFFGYLYHLDAMSDPCWFDYPQDWIDKTGPRTLTHCWATGTEDPTVMPRWGRRALLLETFETVLEKMGRRIAPFDDAAAIQAADLMAFRQRKGRPVDLRDTMIAAIVVALVGHISSWLSG